MLWDEPKIFFLERRYFFPIILSEFLKNRVALHWIYHENTHEAIVTTEEFEVAQAALRKVKPHIKKKAENFFPFYCAHCGRKLQRTFGTDVHFYCWQS